eukprot:g5531.t1
MDERRRSWLNLPLISLGMAELLVGRVIADVGVSVRDDWDAAVKKRDLTTQRSIIARKDLAETLFAKNAQAAVMQYLESHPNVEFVVSTQPLFTVPIYNAVVAASERRAKDIHFVLKVTSPVSRFSLFLPGILQWQAEVEPSKRRLFHLDVPRPGRDQRGQASLSRFVINRWYSPKTRRFQRSLRKRLETDGGFYKNLGLRDAVLRRMRMTGGTLPAKFPETFEHFIKTGFTDAGPGRSKPVVLHNLRRALSIRGGAIKHVRNIGNRMHVSIRKHEQVILINTRVWDGTKGLEATLDYLRIFAQRGVRKDDLTGNKNRLVDLCQPTTIIVLCHYKWRMRVARKAARIQKLPGPGPQNYRDALRVYALGSQFPRTLAAISKRANKIVLPATSAPKAFKAVAAGVGAMVIAHTDRPLESGGVRASGKGNVARSWSTSGIMSRVCTAGLLPHQAGYVAWLAETLPHANVNVCDGKVCERLISNSTTGRVMVEDDPEAGRFSCLSDRDPAYRVDYGAAKETESLGC